MVLFPERIVQLIFLTLFSIFTPAQGFLIFIFYCLNFKVRQAVPPFLMRLCDCVQQLTAGSSVNPGHW